MDGFDFVAWVFLYFPMSKRVWISFYGWLVWVFELSYCWDFFFICESLKSLLEEMEDREKRRWMNQRRRGENQKEGKE